MYAQKLETLPPPPGVLGSLKAGCEAVSNHVILISLPFLLGAGLYYYLMYRSSIIPRWLSVWGLLAVALSLVATLYSGFTQDFGFSTFSTALNAPIALQEMVLAVWLIAKGFNREPQPPPAQTRR